MARILNRYGVGVPKGDAFAGVGEILIDADSGVAYTITIGGEVKPLGGDGSSDGSGAGMVISETEPADPVDGMQWMDATTAIVWVWDEDKWLEFPAGKGGGTDNTLGYVLPVSTRGGIVELPTLVEPRALVVGTRNGDINLPLMAA